MSDYRRSYIPGGCWFFTVNLQNRRSDLLTRHIVHLRAAIASVKSKKPFLINAWVVLPEHMHCIWTLPEGDTDYSGRWRDIKKMFTRALAQHHICRRASATCGITAVRRSFFPVFPGRSQTYGYLPPVCLPPSDPGYAATGTQIR